jgi:hypothetical protein
VADEGLHHVEAHIANLASKDTRLMFRPRTSIDDLEKKVGVSLDGDQRAALQMLVDGLDDQIADATQVGEMEKYASIKYLIERGVFENIPAGNIDIESARANNPGAMIAVVPGPTSQTLRLLALNKHNSPLAFAAEKAGRDLRARKTAEIQSFFNRVRGAK